MLAMSALLRLLYQALGHKPPDCPTKVEAVTADQDFQVRGLQGRELSTYLLVLAEQSRW